MASLFFYEKSSDLSIFDIEYFGNNKVVFDKVIELLNTNAASYGSDNVYNKEGYTQIKMNSNRDILSCAYIFENTLGNYTEIKYDENTQKLVVNNQKYSYYARIKMSVTSDLNIIIKANLANEERSTARSKCLTIFNDNGLEVEKIKLTNEVFQYIRNNYEWKKIKIQQIKNEGDSTKSVSYEIDPSSDKTSEVDNLYKDSGTFEHISFYLPFNENKYVVKLYKEKNKISVEESQFSSEDEFDKFCVFLLELMVRIKNGVVDNDKEQIDEECEE